MGQRLALLALFLVPAPAGTPAAPVAPPVEERAAPAGDLDAFLKPKGYLGVPLNLVASGHLDIEVKVKGETLLFILDTGAGASVIDAAVAKRLGLAVQKTDQTLAGVGGSHPLEKTVLDPMMIGPVQGREEAVVTDLGAVNTERKKVGARPCDGLLGAGVLQLFGAVIDYPSSKVFLLDQGAAARATFEVPAGAPYDGVVNRTVQAGRLTLGVVATLHKDLRPVLTQANFDKLRPGMTYPQVAEVLGAELGKARMVKGFSGTFAVVQDKSRIELAFEDGKVTTKSGRSLE
jgi:hypothetical protein